MYAPQSSRLAAPRGTRFLPVIMSAIVLLTIVALAFGVRAIATQQAASPESGAGAASQQYDSPALRGGSVSSAASQQYDSPALRGGSQTSVAIPKTDSFDAIGALRKEHLGIAPTTIATTPVVTGRDRMEVHRLEHLGVTSAATKASDTTSFDSWDSLRREHLGVTSGATKASDTTSSDSWDSLRQEHLHSLTGGGR